jgi:hypothetical protein
MRWLGSACRGIYARHVVVTRARLLEMARLLLEVALNRVIRTRSSRWVDEVLWTIIIPGGCMRILGRVSS